MKGPSSSLNPFSSSPLMALISSSYGCCGFSHVADLCRSRFFCGCTQGHSGDQLVQNICCLSMCISLLCQLVHPLKMHGVVLKCVSSWSTATSPFRECQVELVSGLLQESVKPVEDSQAYVES
jgi:hypothetical protein